MSVSHPVADCIIKLTSYYYACLIYLPLCMSISTPLQFIFQTPQHSANSHSRTCHNHQTIIIFHAVHLFFCLPLFRMFKHPSFCIIMSLSTLPLTLYIHLYLSSSPIFQTPQYSAASHSWARGAPEPSHVGLSTKSFSSKGTEHQTKQSRP